MASPTENLKNRIEKVQHSPAQKQNPSDEPSGRDYLTWNVKYWIVLPVLSFQMIGIAILICIAHHFIVNDTASPYVWPALIAAFAGMPFGFAANVRKLVDVVTISSN